MIVAVVSPEEMRSLAYDAVQRLVERLANQSGLKGTIQQGHNETYAWWIVARFCDRVGTAVELSVEWKGLEVHADIAYEDGRVLEEMAELMLRPIVHGVVSAPIANRERVIGFIDNADSCILRHLAR